MEAWGRHSINQELLDKSSEVGYDILDANKEDWVRP